MGKFNLLTTLSLNASGMSDQLKQSVADIEAFVDSSKAKNIELEKSFQNVSQGGVEDLKKELSSVMKISFAGKSEAEIKVLRDRTRELTKAIRDTGSGFQVTGGDISDTASTISPKIAGLKRSFVDVSEMGVGAMRSEIKLLNKENFGGKTKEEILIIKNRIGELRDAMGDLKSEQAILGTEMGSAMAKGLQAVSAVAEGAVGVATLMGVSKEKAEKYQQTMIALIGITQAMGVIQDALETRLIQNIALKVKDAVVTMAQTVATNIATVATWALNASLIVLSATIAIIVLALAVVAVGVYYLVKAFSASDSATDKSIAKIKELGDAHRDLLGLIQENASRLTGSQMEMLVATGKMKQKEFDIWKLNEIRKKELIDNSNRQIASIKEVNDKLEIEKEGKKLLAIRELEGIASAERMQILIDTNKNIDLINANYAQSVANLTIKTTGQQVGAYDQLTKKISDLKEKIGNVITQGGTVTPEMTEKLIAYERQLIKVNEEIAKQTAIPMERVANVAIKMTGETDIPEVKSGKDKYKIEQKEHTENLKKKYAISMRYREIELTEAQKDAQYRRAIERETQEMNLGSMADSFGQMSGLFDQNTIAYKGMAIAQATISTWLAGVNILANTAKLGPIAMGLAFASTIATGMMTVGKIAGVFENGGIVGGSSYSGDKLTARVNSREMILNETQQGNLFAMANGAGQASGGSGGEVTFRINGTTLVGVLQNINQKIKNTR